MLIVPMTGNRREPFVKAWRVGGFSMSTSMRHFIESIPEDGVVTGSAP